MKTYGKFETVKQVCKTPVAEIWSARAVGTRGAPMVSVKLIHPDSPVFSGRGKVAAEEMLLSAALQQSIANKSEHWAPIYELGYDGNNAFYVSKLFDRSLQRLIDLRVKLTSADLLTIVSAMVEGLLDLRTAFNRVHGNLKPANVLISGRGRINKEDIRLTDPHAGDQDVASVTRSPDVKAIGEILFALVTGRPHSVARWPVPESADWSKLGGSGGQWWSLCNDMLNTLQRGGPMSLEKVQARLSMMRITRRKMSKSWIGVAALLALAACGYVFRDREMKWVYAGKQWAVNLKNHSSSGATQTTWHPPGTAPVVPAAGAQHPVDSTKPAETSQDLVLKAGPPKVDPIKTDPPKVEVTKPELTKIQTPNSDNTHTATKPPVAVADLTKPDGTKPDLTAQTLTTNPPVITEVPKVADPAPITLPAFLPGTAAAKFLATISQLNSPDKAVQRRQFADAVTALDSAYPPAEIKGDRPWQKELGRFTQSRRESELTTAVGAVAAGQPADSSAYSKFCIAAQQFNTEAASAEDMISSGSAWLPDANRLDIQKSIADATSLFADDAHDRAVATPSALEEMRAINDAVASQRPKALLSLIHDQNSSVPARVAAWQALDLPQLHHQWPADSADFVAAQKDGDSLVSAARGTNLNPQVAIRAYQDQRLQAFYTTLNSQVAVSDAVTHLAEIENGRGDQRPLWLEYDRILYSMANTTTAPSDADLAPLRAMNLPAATELYNSLLKAKTLSASNEPLLNAGPGQVKWSCRPFSASGASGCIYSAENSPSIEFIRVEPPQDKGLPFYLSTTEISVGMVAALLNDSEHSTTAATDALRTLCPPAPPAVGSRDWKFSTARGIELDIDDYVQYFRQAPTLDMPIQQITPQGALYLARTFGCRLPTSNEWQSALAMAMNPKNPDDPIKGFACGGWKLRDANFSSLVDRAAITQRFPDEGAFAGPDPSTIPTGSSAGVWATPALRKLGGWTVAELRTDRQAQRLMAKLDSSSSDFRADLIDAPQVGFRPVGTVHHVFHDLVGNVAEFVLDTGALEEEGLPVGSKVTDKSIASFFAAGDRTKLIGVIGGSFLSAPELDPATRIPLPANATNPAYADVGFRLAFTDPRAYADTASVIRHTGFLYPPPPVKTAEAKN